MATTSAQAIYGLTSTATPSSVNTDGTLTIGKNQTAVNLSSVSTAYCVQADLADTETLTLDVAAGTGTSTGSGAAATLLVNPDGTNNSFDVTAQTAGNLGNLLSFQIFSPIVSAATTVSIIGNKQIRVQPGTKARMIITGTLTDGTSPVTFPTLFYAGVNGGLEYWTDTGNVDSFDYSAFGIPTDWNLNTTIGTGASWSSGDSYNYPDSAEYTPSGDATGTPIVTAGISSAAHAIAAVNAATDIVTAAANGTVTGAVAAYAETFLAGGLTSLAGGDGNDFQGHALPTLTTLYGLQINVPSGSAHASNGTQSFPLPAQFFFTAGHTDELLDDDLVITATADNTCVEVIVMGS
jgi:hypothetical protein